MHLACIWVWLGQHAQLGRQFSAVGACKSFASALLPKVELQATGRESCRCCDCCRPDLCSGIKVKAQFLKMVSEPVPALIIIRGQQMGVELVASLFYSYTNSLRCGCHALSESSAPKQELPENDVTEKAMQHGKAPVKWQTMHQNTGQNLVKTAKYAQKPLSCVAQKRFDQMRL